MQLQKGLQSQGNRKIWKRKNGREIKGIFVLFCSVSQRPTRVSSNPGQGVLVMKAMLLAVDRETERKISRSFVGSPSVRRDQVDVVKLSPASFFLGARRKPHICRIRLCLCYRKNSIL